MVHFIAMRTAGVAFFLLMSAACTPEAYLPDPVVETPLAFDPTEQYELSEWWTNGQQLLRLSDDHSYRLYEGQSRYGPPSQRGRWSQVNYAALRLEPYAVRGSEPIRVSITKRGDEISLLMPRLERMHAIAAPPRTLEDALVGEWSSEEGLLSIRRDQRYSFTPESEPTSDGAFIAGHQGSWRLDEQRLILLPDAPKVEPVELRLEMEAAEGAGEETVGEDPGAAEGVARLIGPDATYRPVEADRSSGVL